MRIQVFAVSAMLLGVACTASSVTVANPVPVDGKAMAPVDMRAELFDTEARVTLVLQEDARDLVISAWGIDGLQVRSSNALAATISKRGERQTLVIPFTAGPPRSNLVISVRGLFHGATLQRVATFAVGSGSLPKTGEVVVTDQGDVLKSQRAPTPKLNPTDSATGQTP